MTRRVDRELIAYADLAVTGWDFAELDAAGPGDILVGGTFWFGTTKSVRHGGDTVLDLYDDPADVRVSRSMTVPEGVTGWVRVSADEPFPEVVIRRDGQPDVVFASGPGIVHSVEGGGTIIVNFRLEDFAPGEERDIAEEFGLECVAPGSHEIAFVNTIEAVDPHLLDPDTDDNTIEVERTIECVVPVQINVRPGNQHNFVNPGSSESMPVAVLTTEQGEYGLPLAFDAASIEPASALFGTLSMLGVGGGSMASRTFIRDSFELDDSTKDGDLDMALHFPIPGTGADDGTTEMCVLGQFMGEGGIVYTFFGCDAVLPQGPDGND